MAPRKTTITNNAEIRRRVPAYLSGIGSKASVHFTIGIRRYARRSPIINGRRAILQV